MNESSESDRPRASSPFEWKEGLPHYRGLKAERRRIEIEGHRFSLLAVRDAADLLDLPDVAKSFVEDDRAPYGMELWPAALMLAGEVLRDEPGDGRWALEIGCGLGLVSMAATIRGWRMIATDYDAEALRLARYNAECNDIAIEQYDLLDWHNPPTGVSFARIFGADVLYQRSDHVPILNCVDRLLAPDGTAQLADPNRSVADGFTDLAEQAGLRTTVRPTSTISCDDRRHAGRVFHLAAC